MSGFLLRIVINAVVLFVIQAFLPGIFVDTLGGLLLGAAIIGLVNAVIRPVLSYLAAPFDVKTLGIFTLGTNIAAAMMVVLALPGYQISGVVSPAAGLGLMSVCSVTLTKVIQDR